MPFDAPFKLGPFTCDCQGRLSPCEEADMPAFLFRWRGRCVHARIAYRHGSFVNAADDAASEANERNAIALRLPDGREIAVVQIAGLIARRIVCDLREGDAVHAGQRLGIIRFGSRTDLYLPIARIADLQ